MTLPYQEKIRLKHALTDGCCPKSTFFDVSLAKAYRMALRGMHPAICGTLDALTRVQVRHDLEQLWIAERPTALFTTHSVEEAVGLGDRVLVMAPSPGQVVDEIKINLSRPRPVALGEEQELAEYSKRIYDHFARLGVIHQ